MTFTEIATDVTDRLNLSSADASVRIGKAINRKYREVTSAVGLITSRRTEVSKVVTIGNTSVAFSGLEKIVAVIDKSSGSNRVIPEITFEEMQQRATQSGDRVSAYAIQLVGSTTQTIRIDNTPLSAFTLYAEGWATVATLSGSNVPGFPESFHDILVEGVLADEYRKLEKLDMARESRGVYEKRMSELRMWIATSAYLDFVQGGYRNLSPDPTTTMFLI